MLARGWEVLGNRVREGGSWREDRGKEVLRKRRRERRAKEMDGSGRGLKRVGGVVLTRVEERRC